MVQGLQKPFKSLPGASQGASQGLRGPWKARIRLIHKSGLHTGQICLLHKWVDLIRR